MVIKEIEWDLKEIFIWTDGKITDCPCADIVNGHTEKRKNRDNIPFSLGEVAFGGYKNSLPDLKRQYTA